MWLNARSLNVISTALRVPTNVPLAFSHLPPAPPTLTNPNDIHTYPELKRAAWRGALEGEEGELGIAIPQGCIVKVPPPDGATPREEAKKEDEWEQIVLVVEYEVVKPGSGIVVVAPDEANPSVSYRSCSRSSSRELTVARCSASLTSSPPPFPTPLLAPGSHAPTTPKIAAPGTSSSSSLAFSTLAHPPRADEGKTSTWTEDDHRMRWRRSGQSRLSLRASSSSK